MRIDGGGLGPMTYGLQARTATPAVTPSGADKISTLTEGGTVKEGGFVQQVKGAIDHVNGLQAQADTSAINGGTEDTHKSMIAMEHALLALDFTLQVRNKVLDAYQEIMKTQV
jgi:flagellar hook-basal body complex protein FliE